MSGAISPEDNQKFQSLITSIHLADIQMIKLEVDKPAFGQTLQIEGAINISWNQAIADGDPIQSETDKILFRPKYEIDLKKDEQVFFHLTAIFGILFAVNDRASFDTAWQIDTVKGIFYQKQLLKTMWPILRGQVLDGMGRLGIKAVPLPWIVG